MHRLARIAAITLSCSVSFMPLATAALITPIPTSYYNQNPTPGQSGEAVANFLTVQTNAQPIIVSPTPASSGSLWSRIFGTPSPSPAYNQFSPQSPDMYGRQNSYTSTNNVVQDYSRSNPSSGTTGGQGFGGPEPAGGSLSGSGASGASSGAGSAAGTAAGSAVGIAGAVAAGAILSEKAGLMCTKVTPNKTCEPCFAPIGGPGPDAARCVPDQFMCPGSCQDVTPGGTVLGVCVLPGKCQGVSAPGLGGIGGGLLSTLGVGVLMGAVTGVVGKLISGVGPSGGAAGGAGGYGSNPFGSTNPTAQGCSSYTPVSDVAQLSQPCTYYVPASGTGTGTTGTGTTCSTLDQALGLCGGTATGTTGTGTGTTCTPAAQALGLCGTSTSTSATNGSVSATPTSGPAPLSVTFTVTDTSTSCVRDPMTLSYGDAAAPVTVFPATSACGARNPATLTHTYATSSSFVARLKNGASGVELSSVTITATAAGSGGGGPSIDVTTVALAAAPSSGPAPLSVSIIASDTSPVCPHEAVAIYYGDATPAIPVFDGTTSCGSQAQQFTHTYATPGSYRLALVKGGDIVMRSITISVGAPSPSGSGTQGGVQTTFDPVSQPITSGVQSSDNQATISGTQASAAPGGPTGDIKLFGAGATISASAKDAQTNTTVSGFVGGNTNSATNDKNVAQRLCVSRPWSSNFLSYVIPPSFFDSLCSMRGYEIGQPTTTPAVVPTTSSTQTQVKPQVQLTQQPVKTTPATKPATTTPTLTTPAKIDVWAVPASVPVGSRTSIFWNAEGVESCLITSPDGSFTQNVSGASLRNKGASTVPITAATTFSMSCIRADSSHVTDFVTVKISI